MIVVPGWIRVDCLLRSAVYGKLAIWLRVGRSATTAAPCKVSCLARPPQLVLVFLSRVDQKEIAFYRAERNSSTLRTSRKEGSGSRHGKIEDRTQLTKIRWAVILVSPAAHAKELVGTAIASL